MVQRAIHTIKCNAIQAWITKRPALSFYLLTLTLSWGYWFALLAQGQRVTPGSAVTHFPGLPGPMLAAMVVTAVVGGRKALHELFGRMFRLADRHPLVSGRTADHATAVAYEPIALERLRGSDVRTAIPMANILDRDHCQQLR